MNPKKSKTKESVSPENLENFTLDTVSSEDHMVDGRYYLHLVFLQAINAPHQSLMQGRPMDGLISLQIAADQAIRIALSMGTIKEEEIKKRTDEYKKKIKNITNDIIRQTKIADFQLFLILEKYTETAAKKGAIII